MIVKRQPFKVLWLVLKNTRADRILSSYLLFVFVDAALIWIFEPTIHTYRDALWYCYAVISTAGFGDVVVTRFIPKALSVLLTAYSLLALAILTGVVVNYYIQVIELRNKETLAAFMDRLERLPDLDTEELRQLSQQVKNFRKGNAYEDFRDGSKD